MKRILAVVTHEIQEAIPPFLFFVALLGLGRLSKVLLLDEYHITAGGTAVAVIGALIVAKAVLVADALPLTNLFSGRPLAYPILWKALIYALITLAFHYLEELIPLLRKYGGFIAAQERLLAEVSWPHFWVVQIWVGFCLVLYCTGVELIRVLGREKVMALVFGTGARVD